MVKPASYTPAASYELVKLMHQTGLPAGVLNLVSGPGSTIGAEIVKQPESRQDFIYRRDRHG